MTSKKQIFLDISFVKTNTQTTIKKVSKRRQHDNKWTWTSPTIMRELRNEIERRVEVWENEKLQFEHFEFSQTFTSVSITYGNTEKNVFYFFYKITRRKLRRGNSFLYQSVNSPYRSRWRIMGWTFPCFPYSYRNTAFSQSKLAFSKCYFIKFILSRYTSMRYILF